MNSTYRVSYTGYISVCAVTDVTTDQPIADFVNQIDTDQLDWKLLTDDNLFHSLPSNLVKEIEDIEINDIEEITHA